jgi:hypothetical protein
LSALLAALMVLSPLAAEAKVLIVTYRAADAGSPVEPLYQMAEKRQIQLFTNLCDRAGVEYRLVNPRGTTTLWARTGAQVWGSGAGAYTEQFDAVVHLGFLGVSATGYTAALGGATTCRPELMTIAGTTDSPTVPQLFVIGGFGAVPAGIADATTCTTGVKLTGAFAGRAMYFGPDNALRTLDGALTDIVVRNSTDPAGGFRTLIGGSGGSITSTTGVEFGSVGGGANCVWCDSLFAPSTTRDSVLLWERPMAHISGASPIVFVSSANDGLGVLDSVVAAAATTLNAPTEGSAILYLAALARLDSLTGGDVFSNKSKLPLKAGFTADGAFAHNTRMHPRGSAVDDSAIVIATLDSIAAYNTLSNRPKIKLTVGVNIDSVDSYPNEKAWWSRLGGHVRYSPQSWVAIADSTKGGGNASFSNPRDPLGRFRPRAAFGDTSTWEGADSSTYKLLRGSRFKLGQLLGVEQLSGLLMPADDDWSPRNATSDGTRLADSTVFAIARAGFSAIRVNSGDGDCDPNYLRGNHKGFFNRQMRYTATSVRGTPINVLAYHGYPLGGASRLALALIDTASTPFWWVKPHKEIARSINHLVYDGAMDYEMFPYDDHYAQYAGIGLNFYQGVELNVKDRLNPIHPRGSLTRMSVNDFSGAATRPARLGWWVLKSVANSMAMVNRLAGRTIMTIAWPEDITP